jgi:hypothetical protein
MEQGDLDMKRYFSVVLLMVFFGLFSGVAGAVSLVGMRPAAIQNEAGSVLLEIFLEQSVDQGVSDDFGWPSGTLESLGAGALNMVVLTFTYDPLAWASSPVSVGGVGGGQLFDAVTVNKDEPAPGSLVLEIMSATGSLVNLDSNVVIATIRAARPEIQVGNLLLKKAQLGDQGDVGTGTQTLAGQPITPIPEPGTLSFVGVGLCGVVLGVHRRRRLMRG